MTNPQIVFLLNILNGLLYLIIDFKYYRGGYISSNDNYSEHFYILFIVIYKD